MPRGRTRGSLREEEEAPATLTKKDLIKLLNAHMAEIQEQFRTNIASSPRSDNVVDVSPTRRTYTNAFNTGQYTNHSDKRV